MHAQLDLHECQRGAPAHVRTAQLAVKLHGTHMCAAPRLHGPIPLPPSSRVAKLQRLRTAVIIDQKLYPYYTSSYIFPYFLPKSHGRLCQMFCLTEMMVNNFTYFQKQELLLTCYMAGMELTLAH